MNQLRYPDPWDIIICFTHSTPTAQHSSVWSSTVLLTSAAVQIEIVIVAGAAGVLAQQACLVRLVDRLLQDHRLVEILACGTVAQGRTIGGVTESQYRAQYHDGKQDGRRPNSAAWNWFLCDNRMGRVGCLYGKARQTHSPPFAAQPPQTLTHL